MTNLLNTRRFEPFYGLSSIGFLCRYLTAGPSILFSQRSFDIRNRQVVFLPGIWHPTTTKHCSRSAGPDRKALGFPSANRSIKMAHVGPKVGRHSRLCSQVYKAARDEIVSPAIIIIFPRPGLERPRTLLTPRPTPPPTPGLSRPVKYVMHGAQGAGAQVFSCNSHGVAWRRRRHL